MIFSKITSTPNDFLGRLVLKTIHMRTLVLLTITVFSWPLFGQNFPNGFGFYLPPGDSTPQQFLPEFPKNPITDFVATTPDGHFEAGGERLRFWGVNVTTGACFPVKPKAPWIAARMRKMGINLVRFHHMDNNWTDDNGNIFYQNSNTTQVLNFFALDKLHYFLAQLKDEGIYANINLHVSRTFREGDGVLHADSLLEFGKAVTMFDRWLIHLQKQYASQLLSPVNPYTGLAMANDPVVAMVEISNENTLYGYWRDDRLRHFSHGGELMQRHVDSLNWKWNQFLQQKYPSQAALAASWNAGATAPGTNEQLMDGGFENNNASGAWTMELHDAAAATLSIVQTNPYAGQDCARVNVTNVTGTDWHIQFKQVGMSVEAGKAYTVRFAARAGQNATVYSYIMQDAAPYNWYNGQQFNLTTQWQEFNYTFTAPEDNNGTVRMGFSFDNQLGSFFFDNMSFSEAGATGVLPGESLSAGNLRRIDYSERLAFTNGRISDMAEFYLTLQRNYFNEMRTYLRDTISVQVPITGSNAWGGPSDIFTQQDMDYVDDHSYWDHPNFPAGWSTSNWTIENQPMVKSDWWTTMIDVFGGLALKNKPYTISEYRHPFPNRFEVEMMPWMTAYAAFNNADGIMFFDYNGSHDAWEKDMVENHFSLHRNSAQMALSPIFGYVFRNGLIEPEPSPVEVHYPTDYLFGEVTRQDDVGRWGTWLPYDGSQAHTTAIRTSGFGGNGTPDFSQVPAPPGSLAVTSTGQTSVDFEKGMLKTVTPNFVSVCGQLDENLPHPAGAMQVLDGNGFAAVAWLSLSGSPLNGKGKSVLAVSSKTQNTGMVWDGTNSIHDDWGNQPTEMYPMKLTLELQADAASLRVFPLSNTGAESGYTVYGPVSPGRFLVEIDQSANKTLWFGVDASDASPVRSNMLATDFVVSPNPVMGWLRVQFGLATPAPATVSLVDASGRVVMQVENAQPVAAFDRALDVSALPAGTYFVVLQAGSVLRTKEVVFIK